MAQLNHRWLLQEARKVGYATSVVSEIGIQVLRGGEKSRSGRVTQSDLLPMRKRVRLRYRLNAKPPRVVLCARRYPSRPKIITVATVISAAVEA
jgi:hypothetical protein